MLGRGPFNGPPAPSAAVIGCLHQMSKIRALLLFLAGVAAFSFVASDLWTGHAVPPWDAHDFFAPSFIAAADSIRAGHLMLWNPWMVGGIPDFTEPQLGIFSPLTLAMGLVFGGSLLAFRIYFLVVWALSGIGVYLLGRRLRAPAWTSALLAFNWMFSGFLLGHAQHISWMYSIGLLPVTIVVLDQALESGSWRRFAAAGALWGCSLLGGYPGIVFNNAFLLLGWTVGRTFFPAQGAAWVARSTVKRALLAIAGLGLVGVVGCAVMSPNLAGMLIEAVGVTSRSGALPREAAVGNNPLGWWCFSGFASPFLASLPPAKLWPRTDVSMANVYLGALTLTLALTALWSRRRARWCLLAGAVALFLVSTGPETPLRGWLYDWVPFTRYFQHPAMYNGPAMFLLVVLALLGARDLEAGTAKRFSPLLVAALLSVGAYLAVRIVSTRAGVVPTSQAWTHLYLAWVTTAVGLALHGLLAHRHPRWQLAAPLVLTLAVLGDAYLTEKIVPTHAERRPPVVASERNVLRLHRESVDLASLSGLDRAERVRGDLGVPGVSAWALVLKTPVFSGYTALRNNEHEAIAREPSTRQLAVGKNKTWFSSTAIQAPPAASVFAAFMARSTALGVAPLLIHQPDDFRHGRPARGEDLAAIHVASSLAPIHATLLRYTPTTLGLQVEAPGEGWLMVTDRWAPGWRVEVNGQPQVLHPADFVFRAVRVKAGANRIDFAYKPSTLIPTLLLCWGSLLLVGLLQLKLAWLLAKLRRPKPMTPAAG